MIPQRSASVGWQARMDWSEAERRPVRRAGDQAENGGEPSRQASPTRA